MTLTSPEPDPTTPGQTSTETQTYEVSLDTGDFLHVGQIDGVNILLNVDGGGNQWLYAINAASGAFTAALLNYDGSYNPASDPTFSSGFQPDAAKWTMAWSPATASWTTVAPGALATQAASGFVAGEWNYVVLDQPPLIPSVQPNPPAQPPAPNQPQPIVVVVTIGQGITIAIPVAPGNSVTITPAPGGGVTIVNGGQPQVIPVAPQPMIPPPNFEIPPAPLPWWHVPAPPQLPVAPPPRPVIIPPSVLPPAQQEE